MRAYKIKYGGECHELVAEEGCLMPQGKIYKIKCAGECHRIAVHGDGFVELLDHDIEEEEARAEFGDESRCFRIGERLMNYPAQLLTEAVNDNNRELLKAALACGANLEHFAYNSLRLAISLGNTHMVHFLLERIGEVDGRFSRDMISLAINEGNADILWLLLESGLRPSTFVQMTVAGALRRKTRNSDPISKELVSVLAEYFEEHDETL